MDPPYLYPGALLLQFARAPALGQVKTRLQPVLSAEQCLALHRQLVSYTSKTLLSSGLAPVQIWSWGEEDDSFFREIAPGCPLYRQSGGDLGERMHRALEKALQASAAVVLVGSDCPGLNRALLAEALAALRGGTRAVLGPALDGGYYLLGLRRADRRLFSDISWGTNAVLVQTRQRLRDLDWQWHELKPLADIDRPQDLRLLEGIPAFRKWQESL